MSKRYLAALVVGSLVVGIGSAAVLGDSLGARLAAAALVVLFILWMDRFDKSPQKITHIRGERWIKPVALAIGITLIVLSGFKLSLILFGALGGIAGFLFSRQERQRRY